MSKPYHSLPEAIKGIVLQMGNKVIESITFVNILSDLYDLDDIPAAKKVLKTISSEGYGTEILSTIDSSSWNVKNKLISAKIATQNGFKEDLTSFVLDSIYYAIGKIDKEPQYIVKSNNAERSLIDLEIELKKIKGDYLTFLDDNIVISDDSPAYYEANDKSEIFEYQGKIEILNKVLGKKDILWCKERYDEIVAKYTPVPKSKTKIGFFKRLFG